jgi:hypothetical protein
LHFCVCFHDTVHVIFNIITTRLLRRALIYNCIYGLPPCVSSRLIKWQLHLPLIYQTAAMKIVFYGRPAQTVRMITLCSPRAMICPSRHPDCCMIQPSSLHLTRKTSDLWKLTYQRLVTILQALAALESQDHIPRLNHELYHLGHPQH